MQLQGLCMQSSKCSKVDDNSHQPWRPLQSLLNGRVLKEEAVQLSSQRSNKARLGQTSPSSKDKLNQFGLTICWSTDKCTSILCQLLHSQHFKKRTDKLDSMVQGTGFSSTHSMNSHSHMSMTRPKVSQVALPQRTNLADESPSIFS